MQNYFDKYFINKIYFRYNSDLKNNQFVCLRIDMNVSTILTYSNFAANTSCHYNVHTTLLLVIDNSKANL